MSYAAKMRVRGKLPQKKEVIDWGSGKILAYLSFVDFFTVDGKFECTVSRLAEAELRLEDEPFWDEFLERIGHQSTMAKFRMRLTTMTRVVLAWLKSNPYAITEEMYVLMKKNPRLAWAVSSFQLVKTETGAEIVVRANDDVTDPGRKNADPNLTNVNSPLVQFEQAKLSLVTLAKRLVSNLPPDELKRMSAKDKIAAFNSLMNTAQRVFSGAKPNSVVFQQINVNKAGRQELEKAFLEYAETQTEEESA